MTAPPPMTESKQAYDFALEVAKQLITLSTAIITLTVALSKDVFKSQPRPSARVALVLSWAAYLASIWYGVQHIQGLTGSLEWASIERAARGAREADRQDSVLAARYLDPRSSATTQDSARQRMSLTGVLIGQSAKANAIIQLDTFVVATGLAVLYGVLMLFGTRNPTDPEDDREPRKLTEAIVSTVTHMSVSATERSSTADRVSPPAHRVGRDGNNEMNDRGGEIF